MSPRAEGRLRLREEARATALQGAATRAGGVAGARPWRGIVVGCGRMGSAHAERIAVHPESELAGVWDTDPARANALAARHATAEAPDLDELLRRCAADWAVVATPPSTHRSLSVRLLEAGLHVLCEKPLARSAGEANAILAAASRAARIAWTSTKYPHVPDVRRARELVREGEIGDLRRVEVVFSGRLDPRADWRAEPLVAGGGVLMDNGPHAFDLLEFLAGPVASLRAREGERPWGSPVDEEVHLELRGAAGWEGAVALSWTRAAEGPDYARIVGTRGEIRLGWKGSAFVSAGAGRALGPGYEKLAALDGQLAAFCAAIGGRPPADGDRGLRDLTLVEAAYRALEHGGIVAVPPEGVAPA